MFSCEFCEVSKNTFFTEHLRATASNHGGYIKRTISHRLNKSTTQQKIFKMMDQYHLNHAFSQKSKPQKKKYIYLKLFTSQTYNYALTLNSAGASL